MRPRGQLEYYRSRTDDRLHPYAICATDVDDEPKPLLLEVSPGAIADLPRAVQTTETLAAIAAGIGQPCVVLRPTGRGPGSLYQNYGEVDVLEAIAAVRQRYAIDPERITITGSSMGGAATWYLISHYPDLFAGAVPRCGYCDYRLWEKPGGLTFPMHPWEEPSWQSRSAALLVENLAHTPVWMVHGEWDRAVGGGVPVEHSRQMARLMGDAGYTCRYTEAPKTGHHFPLEDSDFWREILGWLLQCRKERGPGRVSLAGYSLRHHSSYWLSLQQLDRYGERALLEAEIEGDALTVTAGNVRQFAVGPLPKDEPVTLVVDGEPVGVAGDGVTSVRRDEAGAWRLAGEVAAGEKRPGCSGPIGDLFHDGTVLVAGTSGSEEATFQNRWVAGDAARYFRSRNGGVHRGGIPGENHVDLPVLDDVDVDDETVGCRNLLLYGTADSNHLLRRYADDIPVVFGDGVLELAGQRYEGERVAAIAVFPHPVHPGRYAAVHGGVTADAICWGSHLDMQLLPDYLVYDGGRLLDWGFWGNDWRAQTGAGQR